MNSSEILFQLSGIFSDYIYTLFFFFISSMYGISTSKWNAFELIRSFIWSAAPRFSVTLLLQLTVPRHLALYCNFVVLIKFRKHIKKFCPTSFLLLHMPHGAAGGSGAALPEGACLRTCHWQAKRGSCALWLCHPRLVCYCCCCWKKNK